MRLRTLLLWIFVANCVFPPSFAAAFEGGYLSQLLAAAQRKGLAERAEWRALPHYQPLRLSQGVESEVDEPGFFLSTQGKKNPQDELNATLQGFFKGNESDPDNSPQCLYVARYNWLKQELDFDRDRLPEIPCNRFHKWFEEMNPGQITLVFPAAYLNNPASMFGHTLMRVDGAQESKQAQLLAYTINYAADTRQQRGVSYAFKGLFGGYHGRFSIAPYYAAVKTYGDIENRDIWEYRLDLTKDEISQLLRHVWEMRSAWFDYYFLDENCSYHLLSLLETARPGLRLTDRFHGWTIPSETVRVLAEAGLVKEVRFRPARNTILQERMRFMDSEQQELARRLSLGELAADSDLLRRLPPGEQARVLELASDYAAYRLSRRFGGVEPNTGKVSELLTARSLLDVPDQAPEIPTPKMWPGEGHKPARARISYGIEDRRQFIELAAAPAYHDIMDPEGGYSQGARVSLLKGALRYYPETEQAELEQIDVIDIMSSSSWNRFLHPVSWKVALGVVRKHLADSERPLMGRFNVGVGISHNFSRQTSAYVFGEGTVELGNRLAYFAAPGVGPRVGIVHDFSERLRTGISYSERFFSCTNCAMTMKQPLKTVSP